MLIAQILVDLCPLSGRSAEKVVNITFAIAFAYHFVLCNAVFATKHDFDSM